MSFEQTFVDMLQSFNPVFSEEEKIKLRDSARGSGLQKWKWMYRGQAMLVGGASGLIPSNDLGQAGSIMLADLSALLLLSARASFGLGHIVDINEVNYGEDIMGILGQWTGVVEAVSFVPAGKVGLKLSVKALPKVVAPLTAHLAYATIKTNGKLAAKLASKVATKMATKVGTKLLTKEGIKAFSQAAPLISSGASLYVNLWIINDIMKAAEQYYSNPYLVIDDELGGLAPA